MASLFNLALDHTHCLTTVICINSVYVCIPRKVVPGSPYLLRWSISTPSTNPLELVESAPLRNIISSAVWGVGDGEEMEAFIRRRFTSFRTCLFSKFLPHLQEERREGVVVAVGGGREGSRTRGRVSANRRGERGEGSRRGAGRTRGREIANRRGERGGEKRERVESEREKR